MKKTCPVLTDIDHNEGISELSHYEFLYHLQHSLLLALREQGRLNAMEYHHAEEKLKQQRRDRAKNLLKKGRGSNQSSRLLPCLHG